MTDEPDFEKTCILILLAVIAVAVGYMLAMAAQ